MRIALVSDWFLPRLGGIELHLRDLAEELARRGHEVVVLTPTPADAGAQGRLLTADVSAPPGVAVDRIDVSLVPGLRVTFSPRAARAFERRLRAGRYDVVHVHASIGSTGALAGAMAAHRLGLPIVLTAHSHVGVWTPLYRAFDRMFGWMDWPHVVSAVSDTVARDLGEAMHGRDVVVLPNGIDPAAWRQPGAPSASRSGGNGTGPTSGQAPIRLVSVMRLQRKKRGRTLLDVVARAEARTVAGRRFHLTFIGDGPARGRLERRARRLGMESRVHFAGYLPRRAIRERFAEADAFVLASERESFGLAALEARCAGLPVVARGDCGVGELFGSPLEALLATDDRGLVDALVRLADEPGLLARMREHNRERVPDVSWDRVIRRHETAYARARAVAADSLPRRRPLELLPDLVG